MTEIEKINSSELGQIIKQIMELLSVKPDPERIYLIDYLKESAEQALTWDLGSPDGVMGSQNQYPIPNSLLEQILTLQNEPETYETMIYEMPADWKTNAEYETIPSKQEKAQMEKNWTKEFRAVLRNLKRYAKKQQDENLWKQNTAETWELMGNLMATLY